MDLQPDYRRLLTTIHHAEPDRVPMLEFLVDPPLKEAVLGRPVRGVADDVEFWHRAGYDHAFLWPLYPMPGMTNVILDFDAENPVSIESHEKGVIRTMADVEAYPWPDAEQFDFSDWIEAARILPDGMGVMTGETGTFSRPWMLMGFENFAYALSDQPALIEELFRRVGSHHVAMIRRLVTLPRVFAILLCSDMAYTEATMISPSLLRKYLFPWIEEMVSVTHAAGMPFILHSDGRLHDVLEDLIAIGVDALNPIEPKAMDINDLKRRCAGRLAIFGNIDLGSTLVLGTPADVKAEVRQRILDLAPGGGYGVSSSNSIARYVPAENYHALREAVLEYGQYPIRL